MDSSRCMRSSGDVLVVTPCEILWPLSRGESRSLAVGLLGMAWLWVGCTKAELSQIRKSPTGIAPDEAVAVVLDRFSNEFSLDKEDEFAGCIGEAIHQDHPNLLIVPPAEFRRVAFPDLAPQATPSSPEYLALLVDHPQFRERIASLGIRYLISVYGRTVQSTKTSEFRCGGGYGGVGCFGVWTWDRESRLAASVLDLKETRAAGEVQVSTSGRPWLVYVGSVPPFGIPLGLPAFTETRACRELGEAVAKFLAGGNPAEP